MAPDRGAGKEVGKFGERMRRLREAEWRRDARLLRGRTPEETLHLVFDLVDFAEKLSRARK